MDYLTKNGILINSDGYREAAGVAVIRYPDGTISIGNSLYRSDEVDVRQDRIIVKTTEPEVEVIL